MDKNTLSNYGWVVITVLVLAVMLAFATPFGTFIKDAVWNTTEALFATNNKALDTALILDEVGGSGEVEEPTPPAVVEEYLITGYTIREGGLKLANVEIKVVVSNGDTYNLTSDANGYFTIPKKYSEGTTITFNTTYTYEDYYNEVVNDTHTIVISADIETTLVISDPPIHDDLDGGGL